MGPDPHLLRFSDRADRQNGLLTADRDVRVPRGEEDVRVLRRLVQIRLQKGVGEWLRPDVKTRSRLHVP